MRCVNLSAGTDAWLVVLCSWSVILRVEVSVKLVMVFFGIATFVLGGGGVVWRPREYMYLWVTLYIVGLVYFSHSVWPVRLLG